VERPGALIRTGLRISSMVTLPFDRVVTDAGSAPYPRYWNTKMKREALVPIDDEVGYHWPKRPSR
jgi:hypothetical protein